MTTTAIVAIVSLGISLATLVFGDSVKGWFMPPRLSLRVRKVEGVLALNDKGERLRFFHLDVRNDRRWKRASNVRVHVRKIEHQTPSGGWVDAGLSGPIPLGWQYGQQGAPHFSPHIPPERICDLAFVHEPTRTLSLAVEFQPFTFPGVLRAAGALRVTIVAVAEEAESRPLRVELAWDGNWADGDDEMVRHLRVRAA